MLEPGRYSVSRVQLTRPDTGSFIVTLAVGAFGLAKAPKSILLPRMEVDTVVVGVLLLFGSGLNASEDVVLYTNVSGDFNAWKMAK